MKKSFQSLCNKILYPLEKIKLKSFYRFCFLFFSLFITSFIVLETYAVLFSDVEVNTSVDLAKWNIHINDVNIVSNYDQTVEINNVNWNSDHTNSNTIAPGSTGTFEIVIDPTDTDVSFQYDLNFVDHQVDSNQILTVTSVSVDGEELSRNEQYLYSGIYTLDDIDNKVLKTVKINVEWVNDEANNDFDSEIGKDIQKDLQYLDLSFQAIQYNGN